MIYFSRHEEQAVQMQSDARTLVSFFIVQDPRLTDLRQERLGRRYKYVFRIHINDRLPNRESHV